MGKQADKVWRPTTCQWIEGNPAEDASKCGAPVAEGEPYCAAHAARAYRKTPSASEPDDAPANKHADL